MISGKGGTGKTSVCASFSVLAGASAVVADCDVDAADMHLLLDPDYLHTTTFISGEKASVKPDLCTGCGRCIEVCRFDAVKRVGDISYIDETDCEGCGYCSRVCPENAIINLPARAGEWFISNIRSGTRMVHARLAIGADNSGKLVAKVKGEARKIALEAGLDLILIDGSPGVGCPVISSLTGASYVCLVTEPSVSALHDLKRVVELAKNFNIKMGCIINKFDINTDLSFQIKNFLGESDIELLAEIPYDEQFVSAMINRKTIVEDMLSSTGEIIRDCWVRIESITKIN